ncbi:hypothetical protein [uncultured Brachyspira sp.]|uniref:hypothetical protein n=1 Tax=uncultured Brachyspira sp. TaxID=221953 RepID=UPI00260B4FF8|nr:hypothetical protein [uncultured Brachyspira sp.]
MIKKLFMLVLSMILAASCTKNPNNPNEQRGGNEPNVPSIPSEPSIPTTSINFDEMFLKFVTDDKTVPTFTFFKDDGQAAAGARQWVQNNDGTNTCYIYNAPDGENKNGVPGSPNSYMPVNSAKIYVYRGVNPFKTKNDNNIESQFYFYRYTGNVVFDLDNFLVAVDTKTGLIFPYAVPEKWQNMFISWAPNGWISAELGKTGVYGTTDQEETFEAHKFWQYDPIGQVNDDGSVTLEQFYIDAQGNNNYKP